MNFTPIGNKVLVKRSDAIGTTAHGVIIPEHAKDKPREGVVVALGSGLLNTTTGQYAPFTVSVNDLVIFSNYSGTEIKIEGDPFLILTEDDILAVIDPTPELALATQ